LAASDGDRESWDPPHDVADLPASAGHRVAACGLVGDRFLDAERPVSSFL